MSSLDVQSSEKSVEQSVPQPEVKNENSDELNDEFMSESVIRPDDLDHELVDAIILRASEQVSSVLLKQREKDLEERRKFRLKWQEERRLFAQNNARYLEQVLENQKRIADEVVLRLPPPKNFVSKFWYATSEFLKGVALISAIWYFWKAPNKPRP